MFISHVILKLCVYIIWLYAQPVSHMFICQLYLSYCLNTNTSKCTCFVTICLSNTFSFFLQELSFCQHCKKTEKVMTGNKISSIHAARHKVHLGFRTNMLPGKYYRGKAHVYLYISINAHKFSLREGTYFSSRECTKAVTQRVIGIF